MITKPHLKIPMHVSLNVSLFVHPWRYRCENKIGISVNSETLLFCYPNTVYIDMLLFFLVV